ncbi:MAG TPA: hypothetical protein VIM60_06175 [Edaphobacter sp.]
MAASEQDPTTSAVSQLRERLNAREDSTNSALSDKVRNLALGLIGFFWAAVSADKEPLHSIAVSHLKGFLAIAVLAVLSLFCDLLNSLFDHFHTDLLLRRLQPNAKKGKWSSALRKLFRGVVCVSFYFKVLFGCAACIVLLALVPKMLTQLKAPIVPETKPPACVQGTEHPAASTH